MKTFYVEVDTNDADYIGTLVNVSDVIFEKFKPLIKKINNFKPYKVILGDGIEWTHKSNFPYGECCRCDLCEKTPEELYHITEEKLNEFVDAFHLYGGEFGFHTINKIVEVEIKNTIL